MNVFLDAEFALERVQETPTEVPTWLVLALRRSD
jgi:hypothetical protein